MTMSEPFLGEIRRFPYQEIPQGWLACDGQIVSADLYATLYTTIANTYGGEAPNTFALPNLQGCVAVSQGGTAGAVGAGEFAPGPAAAYQVVCFAIAVEGVYPETGSEEK